MWAIRRSLVQPDIGVADVSRAIGRIAATTGAVARGAAVRQQPVAPPVVRGASRLKPRRRSVINPALVSRVRRYSRRRVKRPAVGGAPRHGDGGKKWRTVPLVSVSVARRLVPYVVCREAIFAWDVRPSGLSSPFTRSGITTARAQRGGFRLPAMFAALPTEQSR